MLSLKKGIPIANVGEQTIYLNVGDVMLRLSKEFKSKKLKGLTQSQKKKLIFSFQNNIEPIDNKLKKIYYEALEDVKDDKGLNVMRFKQKVQVLPRRDLVEKLYIAGVSGSGKSTYTGKYIEKFKKMFPNMELFVFSSVSEDKAFDKYNPIRIPIDEDLINDPLMIQDFEDSLTVFDDVNTIKDKILRTSVLDIQAEIIEIGRHYNARCIITSHLISNFHSTRQILNECTSITFFPKSSGQYHIKNYLKTYVGLDKHQIQYILNIPSRWITIYRTFPSYIVWENGIQILSDL